MEGPSQYDTRAAHYQRRHGSRYTQGGSFRVAHSGASHAQRVSCRVEPYRPTLDTNRNGSDGDNTGHAKNTRCVIQFSGIRKSKALTSLVAFPEELRQILLSEDIKKVGVALINDARVLWHDLRTDTKNLVDVGLMTRLAVAENPKITVPYVTLGLQTSVEKLLGHTIEKTLGASEWKNDILTDDQLRCKFNHIHFIASLLTHVRRCTRRHRVTESVRESLRYVASQESSCTLVHLQHDHGRGG